MRKGQGRVSVKVSIVRRMGKTFMKFGTYQHNQGNVHGSICFYGLSGLERISKEHMILTLSEFMRLHVTTFSKNGGSLI